MKIICSKSEFLKAIQKVKGVTQQNPIKNIAEYIYIEAKGDMVYLTTTNFQIIVKIGFKAVVEKEGDISIKSGTLSDIVREMPDDDIELSINDGNESGLIVTFRSKNSTESIKYDINAVSGEQFPKFPEFPESGFYTISQDHLLNVIKSTSYAVSSGNTNPALNGIYFKVNNKELTLAATDSRRLALVSENVFENCDIEIDSIIPIDTVSELKSILSEEGKCELFITENKIYFKTDDIELKSDLIDGKYPNYEQVIPKDFKYNITLDKTEMVHAIRQVSILSKESFNKVIVDIDVDEKMIRLSSTPPEVGQANTDVKIIDGFGGKLTIAFNSVFLKDALNNIKDDKIIFKLNTADLPALITPKNYENYINIIMPVKI
ncbi:MAG: DNA polymerase III subunit beta [Actinomycetia bacterium]|nr:DNA polymerase III subunit beta [Actinomycetes bacterium]